MNSNVAAVIFTALTAFAAIRQVQRMRLGLTTPRLSTWILLSLGTVFSLVMYYLAGGRDLVANISNVGSVVACVGTLAIVCRYGIRTLETYDTACLIVGAILTAILWSNHSYIAAHAALQLIIISGYIPMWFDMWSATENSESFEFWWINFFANFIALYPAMAAKDLLSKVFTARGIICIGATLILMLHVERRSQNLKGASS